MSLLKQAHLIAGLTFIALLGATQAGTINWGGAFFTSNYSADGTELEKGPTEAVHSGDVFYELGIFQNADGTEFTPSFSNADEWEDRWVPLVANDNTITSASSEYDDVQRYFGNIATVGNKDDQISTVGSSGTGGVVVHGFQAYIWGYDIKELDGIVQPEWFLVTGRDEGATGATTNNWVVPDSSASNNITFDIQWDIASASEAIVGQIDNNRGGGEMVDPEAPFGESDHQFATVPESGSVFLLLLGTLSLIRRRR